MNTKIKICGIKEAELAYQTARLGADFIGIILHKSSKRYVDLATATAIAEQTRNGGAQPVAVFVNANAEQMLNVCIKTGISLVQLHGDIARAEQSKLPEFIQRIFVLNVAQEGNIINQTELEQAQLNIERDFILFDGVAAGSGGTFNLQNVKAINGLRFFLAGGLNSNNVTTRINTTQAFAVDVSSGVEAIPGHKDLALITDFIGKVKAI